MSTCSPSPARQPRSWPSPKGLALCISLVLAACGGGDCPPEPPAAGGVLKAQASGLGGGLVVLQDAAGREWVVDTEDGEVTLDGVPAGSAYDITVKVPPRERRCQVSQGSGRLGPDSPLVRIACEPRPVIAALLGLRPLALPVAGAPAAEPVLRRLDVSPGDGRLTPAVDLVDGAITRLVADPLGRFVFAVQPADGRVGVFTVAADGGLARASSLTLPAGRVPKALAVDPGGRFLFVTSGSGGPGVSEADGVQAYRIGADGALAATGQPAAGINRAQPLADPTGRFLYQLVEVEGSPGQQALRTLAVANDGQLQPLSPDLPVGPGTQAVMAIDPRGRALLLAQDGEKRVVQVLVRGPSPGAWVQADQVNLADAELPMLNDMQVRWVGGRMVVLATSSLTGALAAFTVEADGRFQRNQQEQLEPPARIGLITLAGGADVVPANLFSLTIDEALGLAYITSDSSDTPLFARVLRATLGSGSGLPEGITLDAFAPGLSASNLALLRR